MRFSQNQKIRIIASFLMFVIFSFVTLKSSVIVLSSQFSNNNKPQSEESVTTSEGKSCGVIEGSCCCGVNAHGLKDCCCSKKTENPTNNLVTNNTDNKFLQSFIDTIKCSNTPLDFQSGSISDYENKSQYSFLCLPKAIGFQLLSNENLIAEHHIFLPFKPPRKLHT